MKYEHEGGVSRALLTELNVREVTPELALGFLQSPPCSVQRVLTKTPDFNAVPLASPCLGHLNLPVPHPI